MLNSKHENLANFASQRGGEDFVMKNRKKIWFSLMCWHTAVCALRRSVVSFLTLRNGLFQPLIQAGSGADLVRFMP